MVKIIGAAATALALSALAGMAQAAPAPALVTTYDFSAGTPLGTPDTFGFEFQANSAIKISQLGIFDSGQDGLAEAHSLGLWGASGNLLAWTHIAAGTSAPLLGLYRYAHIPAVTLTAGSNYFVGVYSSSLADAFHCCDAPAAVDSRISLLGFGLSNNGLFSAPNFDVPPESYANFLIGPASAAPEPAVWTSLLLGVAFAGAALRRRRARTAA